MFDLKITGGIVYDGSGGEPFIADVAIRGERIAAI
jgi:N-acyl-D-amino-acid deacylase